jgi:Domain of unknown function DUF1828
MPSIHDIELLADELCMVRAKDLVPRGHLRLETKFLYPDRSSVDLFVLNGTQQQLLAASPLLSDLGQTTSWLADVQVKPWQSKKRQRLLEDAIYVLGVKLNGGALETTFEPNHQDLEDAVIRLGQACVRVADLSFTRRSSLQVTATDEVEELLSDADLVYQPNAPLQGRHGNIVVVDFLVEGRRRRSAVLTLAAQSTATAHTAANEVFRKHYDLDTPQRGEQRVTVYDDRLDVYRTEDIDRLRDVCEVVPLSARQDLVAVLAA